MKYFQITIFTLIYIAFGFILKLNANEYLLIGVPLALVFQLFVRKKSIQSAWLRTDDKFNFNKSAFLYSTIFAIYPIYKSFEVLKKDDLNIVSFLYTICAIFGAFGCGYAVSKMTKKSLNETLQCVATSGIIGSILFIGVALLKSHKNHTNINFDVETFITSILMYIPVVFVIEEVIFRGILDEHISDNDQKINYWSIVYLSFLWGWWHLPLTKGGIEELIVAAIVYPINHTLIGFFLSFYWRKSGNLMVPGFSHAFIDAIRNALAK